MTREEIVGKIEEMGLIDEEIILFDSMEDAFLGVAERFEQHGHRFFAVYSYDKMLEILIADGSDADDAAEYIEFNVVGCYAGPNTPAILRN